MKYKILCAVGLLCLVSSCGNEDTRQERLNTKPERAESRSGGKTMTITFNSRGERIVYFQDPDSERVRFGEITTIDGKEYYEEK